MNLDFYDFSTLEKEIEKLPSERRVAFAASICERLIYNYDVFYLEEGWGNPAAQRAALDEVWQILREKTADTKIIGKLLEE